MEEELVEQFGDLGYDLPKNIIEKCADLCSIFNIEKASDFVEQWVVFSLANCNGEEPTIPFLEEFERKDLFVKQQENEMSRKNKNRQQAGGNKYQQSGGVQLPSEESNLLTIYGSNAVNGNNEGDYQMEDEIMGSYVCKTPKTKKSDLISRTPGGRQNGSRTPFSPASYSPVTSNTPKSRRIVENDSRVIWTYGNPNFIKEGKWSSGRESNDIQIKQISQSELSDLMNPGTKYMFDEFSEKCSHLADHIFHIGKGIFENVRVKVSEDFELSDESSSQEKTKTIGYISADVNSNQKLSASVHFISSDEYKHREMNLNLSKIHSYGIFPGQIALLTGTNRKDDTLVVEEIFVERNLKVPDLPKVTEGKVLSFIITSGPYTSDDDLVYEPLQDLLSYCKNNKPDMLIMTGPFMKENHPLVNNGLLAESFETSFERMLTGIMDSLGSDITICIVSSYEDTLCNPVYPTHPVTLKRNFPNVHMLPNPCMVEIEGVTFGITSTDILSHLAEEELVQRSEFDKVKRLVSHLFHQGSFYPLFPPNIEVPYDSDLASKFAKIKNIPNFMILPSREKCFIRDINGCLVINPGRVWSTGEGTCARLAILPEEDQDSSLSKRVACQIIKI